MGKLTEPPPTPNPAVHHGAMRDPGHRWSHTRQVHCLNCGLKYADWLEARSRQMARSQNTPDSQERG